MKLVRYEHPQWSMLNELDRMFDLGMNGRFFNETPAPAVDLYEDDDHYYVRAELPGFKKDQIELDLENSVLGIAAKSSGGDKETVVISRSVSVPDDISTEKITAKHEDGVLTVTLPKQEARKPRRIAIK